MRVKKETAGRYRNECRGASGLAIVSSHPPPLLHEVAVALGERLEGLLNAEEAKLLEAAMDAGVARRDLISRAAKFLPRLASAVTDVDISKFLPEQPKEVATHLEKALKAALNDTKSPKAEWTAEQAAAEVFHDEIVAALRTTDAD